MWAALTAGTSAKAPPEAGFDVVGCSGFSPGIRSRVRTAEREGRRWEHPSGTVGSACHDTAPAGASCLSPSTVSHLCFSYCSQLKEMCRRELDKAESEIKKNSSIIGDYKQVGLCPRSGPHALAAVLGCVRGFLCTPPHVPTRPLALQSRCASDKFCADSQL